MGHTDRKPTELPPGIKGSKKLSRVTYRVEGDMLLPTSRYFDLAVHSERTELVKLISWAMSHDVSLVLAPIYVE